MDMQPTSHGIEALIAKLHGEGVDAGRREAARIANEARAAAGEILAQARSEANALKGEASAAAAAQREAADHALALAHRDALLALKEELCVRLAGRLQRIVAQAITDQDLLRRLLLAAVSGEKPLDPQDLDRLMAEATGAMLAEGERLGDRPNGICIRLNSADVTVEVSEQTLTDLLAAHLMPRFIARLNGASHD